MKVSCTAMLLAFAVVAHARPGEPIVLVSTDAAFVTALDDALVPAGMDVVTASDVVAPSLAELSAESRRLADREHATATVWLLPAPAGATLVTYDRKVDRLLVRELPYPSPLTATQAAEAARMVRTMLRALRVTPDSDQLPVTAPPVVAPVPTEPWLSIGIGVGAWFAAPAETSKLAGSVAVSWRPHGLGIAAHGAFAGSSPVMSGSFTGQVSDLAFAVEGRYAQPIAPRLHLVPSAGLALHVVELEGTFAEGNPLQSRRYDPAVRIGGLGLFALARGLEIGLAVSADCLLRRQRYEAASAEILVVPRIQALTHVVVGIRL